MKFMIVFLFGLITIGQVIGEAAQTKDVYGGKRDDDHAGKGLMPGIQYATNVGQSAHYVIAPASQPQNQKYQIQYSSGNHPSSLEPVPYPGVHFYPSKLGPIQYSVAPHQQMSYQPPVQMILAAVQPNPSHGHHHHQHQHQHRGHSGPGHHAHMNGVTHVTIGVPSSHKYSPAPYNAIAPAGQHVVHLPAPHHGHSHRHHQQSAFLPIAIPMQSVHRQPVAVIPTAQVSYAPTAPASQSHHQQQEEQVTATTTVLQPSQHYASAQAEHSQAYQHQQQQYAEAQIRQSQHYQQQPQYSYSIQPSIQLASSKQVAAPSGPTPQYKHESYVPSQYANDPSIPSSYVSLVREFTMNPGKEATRVQQVYYPTPSTPVYSSSKHQMSAVHPTGPGSTVEYASTAGGVQFGNQYYQQLSGKASALSSSKYA